MYHDHRTFGMVTIDYPWYMYDDQIHILYTEHGTYDMHTFRCQGFASSNCGSNSAQTILVCVTNIVVVPIHPIQQWQVHHCVQHP